MEDMDDRISISVKEYEALKFDSRKLLELEVQGVDNWSGYDYIDWEYINTGVRNDEN